MKATLEIQNLKCGGCANTIITRLSALAVIKNVEVNNETNEVSFVHDNANDLLGVKTLLAKLGYPIVGEKNAVTTKAKSFVSCAIGRLNN